MSVKFEVITIGIDECSSASSYLSSELSLEVKITYSFKPMSFAKKIDSNLGIRDRSVILIFGSLTMTFIGDSLLLYSIDSYTNIEQWLLGKVIEPITEGFCSLTINTPSDDDRYSFNYDPVYVFDETKRLLMIKLSEDNGTRFHQLTNNLIIGMNEENLTSLFIKNIDFV